MQKEDIYNWEALAIKNIECQFGIPFSHKHIFRKSPVWNWPCPKYIPFGSVGCSVIMLNKKFPLNRVLKTSNKSKTDAAKSKRRKVKRKINPRNFVIRRVSFSAPIHFMEITKQRMEGHQYLNL